MNVVWTASHFFARGACLLQLRHRYWGLPCGPAVGRCFGAILGTAVSFRRGRCFECGTGIFPKPKRSTIRPHPVRNALDRCEHLTIVYRNMCCTLGHSGDTKCIARWWKVRAGMAVRPTSLSRGFLPPHSRQGGPQKAARGDQKASPTRARPARPKWARRGPA